MLLAPIEEKILKDKPPRNLEEEGIYVGEKPPVPQRNINKMENRLLGETNKVFLMSIITAVMILIRMDQCIDQK